MEHQEILLRVLVLLQVPAEQGELEAQLILEDLLEITPVLF